MGASRHVKQILRQQNVSHRPEEFSHQDLQNRKNERAIPAIIYLTSVQWYVRGDKLLGGDYATVSEGVKSPSADENA